MPALTWVVPKGRVLKDLLPLFEAVGIDCTELREDSRSLTAWDHKNGIQFILSKAMDVPTYVEYGAADVGVAGKDVLMEHGKPVCELADLSIAWCEFVVAVPVGAGFTDVRQLDANSRVASKYPRVTYEYFNRLGIQVEVIPLNGSVELGPLVGLADAIVDISQTGTTLRENGLVVLDRIAESTARFIANPVSFRVEYERIQALSHRMRDVVQEGAFR